jgi:ParB-like chromosome segregation protein Spo0J
MDAIEKSPEFRGSEPRNGPQNPLNHSTKSGVERGSRDIAGQGLAIEHRDIESLIPYARNARTHSDRQVAEIAASIREFGWTNPVLVDGENGIIAGHGRVLAARKLGLASLPVIELAGLSEAQRRAYLLADNKLALNAGWDEEMLAAEVADLVALGVDLDVTGFGTGEVDKLLDLHQQGLAGAFPDEAPEAPALPVSRAGDLWLLGEHRLLCGDATSTEDIDKALGGALADMVFADPPYNVDYEGKTSKRLTIANDALGGEFARFLTHLQPHRAELIAVATCLLSSLQVSSPALRVRARLGSCEVARRPFCRLWRTSVCSIT